ncbi:MAG TPA: VTT domain-containing protein [Bryobacteraceae bacterium]|nr:VTT domain-containing protein [Bryobacteraceae bacterium]
MALGPLGLLLLAFLDSTGMPIPEGLDAVLVYVAMKNPDRAWTYAGICLAGSIIGNTVLYYTARRGSRRFVQRTIASGRAPRFRAWFQRFGLVTVFIPALLPIPLPLKVFVITAGVLRTRFLSFILVVILARIPRYFGEAALGVKLGQESTTFLKRHAWHFAVAAVVLFIALYFLVILNERLRRWRRME